MASDQMVNVQLSVMDPEASDVELNAVVRAVAAELEGQGADVVAVANPRGAVPERVAKGSGSGGSILDVEINLENLVKFGKWLRGRLVGTTTKAKFEYKGATFEFDGRDEAQLAAAVAGFEKFVATIDKSDDDSTQA